MNLLPYQKTRLKRADIVVPKAVQDEMDSDAYADKYEAHFRWAFYESVDERYLHPIEVKRYLREYDIPYREVFQQGQSIGCETYMLMNERYIHLKHYWDFEPWCTLNTVFKLAYFLGY